MEREIECCILSLYDVEVSEENRSKNRETQKRYPEFADLKKRQERRKTYASVFRFMILIIPSHHRNHWSVNTVSSTCSLQITFNYV